MEVGDVAYILAGGHCPYVLRPVPRAARPNAFELVGNCYVQDIMYDEAVGTDEAFQNVYSE